MNWITRSRAVSWLTSELSGGDQRRREHRDLGRSEIVAGQQIGSAEDALIFHGLGPGFPFANDRRYRNDLHFICDMCGPIHPTLPTPPGTDLEASVSEVTGHHVVRHKTQFFGLCSACMARSMRPVEPSYARIRKPVRTAPKA